MMEPDSAERVLASFLPRLQRRWLRKRTFEQSEPGLERMWAAVLFLDVTGFSELTDRLASQGAAGAEQLSRVVAASFGPITDLVIDSGGDVLAFAGDAVIAIWPAAPATSLREAAAAATRCALAVQALEAGHVEPGLDLPLRASIGCGETVAFLVGGLEHRWDLLVAGDSVLQATVCNHHVGSGEVMLSAAAGNLIGDLCRSSPGPDGSLRVEEIAATGRYDREEREPASAVGDGRERAAVLRIVRERVEAGQFEWLAEFRNVTVMFVSLEGLDFDDPGILYRLNPAVEAIQHTMLRYEGTLYQTLADDKGTIFVSIFGLAPFSHEDDAARAVHAATAARQSLSEIGIPAAIGLTTGKVFCGLYGVSSRRQYAVAGSVVNLAARLMQAADDRVLCDRATARAAAAQEPELQFHERAPLAIKGRAEPVATFTVSRSEPSTLGRAPDSTAGLIGRAREVAELTAALDRLVRNGRGGAIALEGEPGIGKTRLLRQLLSEADRRSFRVLVGVGSSIDRRVAYHAWRPIFSQLLGVESRDTADQSRSKVLARLEARPDLARRAPLLNAVVACDLPENETTTAMVDEVRADNTRALLIELLAAEARCGPLLVLLEDAYWLDSASWAVTAEVVRKIPDLLLVVSTRPLDPEPERYRELVDAEETRCLHLSGLSEEHTAMLVARTLGVDSVPGPVAELVHLRARGNPFFSEQLAFALRDHGILHLRGRRCMVSRAAADPGRSLDAGLEKLGLPGSLEGLVTSRIDRLRPDQQLTVKLASVVGASFGLEILRQLHPISVPERELVRRLAELMESGIIDRDAEPADGYAFRHAIVQEAIYGSLPFSQRRHLHRRVAEWFERAGGDDDSGGVAILARHWQRAGERGKAIHYLELAGSDALRSFANLEAASYLSEALALLSESDRSDSGTTDGARSARLELLLGKAYSGASRYEEDCLHFERGLALLGSPVPAGTASLIARLIVEISRQSAHRLWPSHFVGCRRGERTAVLQRARAFETLVETYFYLGRSLLSVYAALRTLNLAEMAGPGPELARGYAILSAIVGFVPLPRLARLYGQRALETVGQTQDDAARLWISIVVGVSRAGAGDWQLAFTLFEDGRRIAEELGDRRRWADAVGNQGLIRLFQGEVDEAIKLLTEGYESSFREQDVRYQVIMLRPKIYCLLRQDRLQEAERLLARLADLLEGGLDAEHQATEQDLLGFRAALSLRHGDREAALRETDRAIDLLVQAQASVSFYSAFLGAECAIDTLLALWGQGGRAQTHTRRQARRACQALRGHARVFPVARPAAFRCGGHYAWLIGKCARARREWQRSLSSAQALGMPHERKRAQQALARHRRGRKES